MNIFLAGGGEPPQSIDIDMAFDESVGGGPILLIMEASVPEIMSREDALKWLLSGPIYRRRNIITLEDSSVLCERNLADIAGIYIMGGNTFKLLNYLSRAHLIAPLKQFIENKRPVLGIGAGAIIMGKTIETASVGHEQDVNAICLGELDGLNYFAGRLIMTNFEDEDQAKLIGLARAKRTEIICITEDSGAVFDGTKLTAVGDSPIVIIKSEGEVTVDPGRHYLIDV